MTPPPPVPRAVKPVTHSDDVARRFAYSYAVEHAGIVWISGQVALTAGDIVGIDDIEEQARVVFDNIDAVIRSAGGTLHDLVETTTYVTDRQYLAAVNAERCRRLSTGVPPTSTLIVVAGLARPEFLVEISAVAIVGPQRSEN